MNRLLNTLLMVVLISMLALFVMSCDSTGQEDVQLMEEELEIAQDEMGNNIKGTVSGTIPLESGRIMIANVGDFTFEPSDIKTLRDDIFNEGYFSIFDILAYLNDEGQIDMEYHFDEDMNTYVMDSLNSMKNCWYIAYYDGGWPERNVFRIDHYPYKDRMYISILETEKSLLEENYFIFREEIVRKKDNDGKVIVPRVLIRSPGDETLIFEDVEVKPYDLRSDIFKPGVVTAIDAIMSLGDRGEITYTLQWYESIGTAGVVKDYFVDTINNASSVGRCGFVYEEGSLRFEGFKGNHIHIPSDTRLINSPEYIEFFWICI